MTATIRLKGALSISHLNLDLPNLIEVHIRINPNDELLDGPDLHERAVEAFDTILCY